MDSIRISSLVAKHVGPFAHLDLVFNEKGLDHEDGAEIHIFTGENGAGKSTILLLLTSFLNYQELMPRINTARASDFVVKTIFNWEEVLDGNLSTGEDFVKVRYGGNGVYVSGESGNLWHYNNNLEGRKSKFGTVPYRYAFFAYSGYRRINNTLLQGIYELTDNPFENALNFSSSVNPQQLLQWIANNKAKEALALARNDKESASKYSGAITKIEIAIAEIVGYKVSFELAENPLNVYVVVNGKSLNFDLLPDGLKSIISWLADLLMRMDRVKWINDLEVFERSFILFLDEIEVHLHPKWQRKVLPAIKKLFKNAQIFISTHSPFVIGSVDGAWVYKLKIQDGNSVLDGEPFLSEDANSYRTILEEVFNVQESFGPDVTERLGLFYKLRDSILADKLSGDDSEFIGLVKELAPQSKELENIIGMELKQISRLKGIPIDNYL